MIGRLEKTVLDCPDPRALASFYAAILGMRVNEDGGSEPGCAPAGVSTRCLLAPTGLG